MQSVYNPYTRELLGEVALLSPQGIDALLERGAAAVTVQPLLADEVRREILLCVAAEVARQKDALALLIAHEGGKPLTDALIEVARAVDGLALAAEGIEACFAPEEIPMTRTAAALGHRARLFREPVGLVVAISAFNHPLNLIVHQVAPAVATGCPVIVKPSLLTPYSCIRLVEMFHQAGVPEALLQVALCDDVVAERLATDARVAYVNFIGSARVGWRLRSLLPPGVRCGLEHGGIAPVIVGRQALSERVVGPILKGGMYHAGQVCVSTQRVFVPHEHAAKLAGVLAAQAQALRVGDPADAVTQVGPLIRPSEVQRVSEWVEEAIAGGAGLLCGGEALGNTCYRPTILFDPPADARISQQEVFGPVIAVYGYASLEEAVARANHPRWAFQASVFSDDVQEQQAVIRGLNSSAVMVNEMSAFRTDWMPFGGRRESGLGVGGIAYGMQDYTQYKLVVEQF